MTLTETKKAILAYRDFFRGDIFWIDDINNDEPTEELAKILDRYSPQLDDTHNDAQSHLSNSRKEIGLHIYENPPGMTNITPEIFLSTHTVNFPRGNGEVIANGKRVYD